MIKVLLISNMYPSLEHPSYGIFVRNFEDNITNYGFHFDKAVIRGRGKGLIEKFGKYVSFFFSIRKQLNNESYDLIYIHYINHSLIPLLFLKNKTKGRLIVNAHGSDVFTKGIIGSLIQRIVRPVVRGADYVVVPSPYYRDVVVEKFKIGVSKIIVYPSGGVNLELFRKKSQDRKKGLFTIGFVSRIDVGKGWDTLLKAVKILVDRDVKDISVLIVGTGAQEYELQLMIEELELKDIVQFAGGLAQSMLVEYYSKMDVFVFPTLLQESLGLVGIEAMACGVPVIGSKIGGIEGYIKPGYNGTMFKPGDHNELADKIEAFVKMDHNQLLKFKQNAIYTASMYDSKKVARELSEKLREIVK